MALAAMCSVGALGVLLHAAAPAPCHIVSVMVLFAVAGHAGVVHAVGFVMPPVAVMVLAAPLAGDIAPAQGLGWSCCHCMQLTLPPRMHP